jgi:hypothetical protein
MEDNQSGPESTGDRPAAHSARTDKRSDGGTACVIYSVAASCKTTQTIWTGTDDGLVWLTRDGGANWTKITPPGVSAWSKIAQIDASRFDDKLGLCSGKPYASGRSASICISHSRWWKDLGVDQRRASQRCAGKCGARRPGADGIAVCRHGTRCVDLVR